MDRELDSGIRRRRLMRRIAGGVAAAGVLALLWVSAVDWLRPSVKRSRIRFGRVERGSLEATVHATGTVIPAHERVVSCPVDARVDRVLLHPGDVVTEGTEILELDTSATRLEVERLEERIAQNHNDRLQRRLELEEKIFELESRLESQRLDLEIARFRLEQNQNLRQDGLISEEVFKEAEIAVKKAEIDLRRLSGEVVAERRLNEARLERLALDAGILRKEWDDARRQLDLANTGAPVAGVLTSVFEEEGATVTRGTVLARIADLESFRIEAKVSDAYAPRLEIGQDVNVFIDDETLAARVAEILPTIEEGTIGFTVDLLDPSHELLRHNLRVDVYVVTSRRDDVLKAPRGPYIRGGGDEHHVFVVDSDDAVRTDVILGLLGKEHCEILDGLKEGDEIIISDVRDYQHAGRLRLR